MHICIHTIIHMYLLVYARIHSYMGNVTKSYTILHTACHLERSLFSAVLDSDRRFFLCCDVFWVIEHLVPLQL
jgi:hypothetical protein